MKTPEDRIRELEERLRMKNLVLEEIRKGHDEPSKETLEKFQKIGETVTSGFEKVNVKLATVATREYINDKFEKHENNERVNMDLFLKKEIYEGDKKWVGWCAKGAYVFSSLLTTVVLLLMNSCMENINIQLDAIHEAQKEAKNATETAQSETDHSIMILSQKLDNLEVTVYTNE